MQVPVVMWLHAVVTVTAIFTLTTSHFAPKQSRSLPSLDAPPAPPHTRLQRRVDLAFEWNKAWCKGAKLAQAMIKSEAQAGTYIDPARSPWDGDLVSAFATWGYRELPHYRDDLCNFGAGQHELQRAFAAMGIGTQSAADGGPNTCYHIEHQNGPSVERDPSGELPPVHRQFYFAKGKRLRETEAYTTLGINPAAGAIFFLNRLSPREAAHENWNIPLAYVKSDVLPDLSSSSDHAWGFWERAMAGQDLGGVTRMFACMITNAVTLALIDEALRTYPLPPGMDPAQRPRGVEKWPGTAFEMHYDAAQALLGSPNGQAVGYFLAQHKARFGRSKTVAKVTVFRADKGVMPYLMFDIIDAPAGPVGGEAEIEGDDEVFGLGADDRNQSTTKGEHVMEERIVRRDVDGSNMLREYIFRARL